MGQIITACIVAIAWIASRAMDWASLKSQVNDHSKWVTRHETESEHRDNTLEQLGLVTVKLTTLLEAMEYRMRTMESDRYYRREKEH